MSTSRGNESDDDMKTTLEEPEVVTKYQMAATIVNNAMTQVRNAAVPGASVLELCQLGDRFIAEECAKIYTSSKLKKRPRGIAFPTCVSVNNLVGHFSPSPGDSSALKEGDLVKIDLGVHVDGFPVVSAQSFVCGAAAGGENISDRQADVINAAYTAAEAAIRLCKPGVKNTDFPPVLDKIARSYGVNLCEGIISHRMDHNNLTCEETIINRPAHGEQPRTEFAIEANTVFQIDLIFSTGEGKTREADIKPTVFRRAKTDYQLKLKASRTLLTEINAKYPEFAFALRGLELEEGKARLGLTECLSHELLEAYPVLEERDGDFVAQIKFTVLVMPSGPLRITEVLPPQRPSTKTVEDADVKALLASSISSKKKKKKNKKKAAAGGASGSAAAEEDGDD